MSPEAVKLTSHRGGYLP